MNLYLKSSSITQSSSPVLMTNKEGEKELVSNFCFPFDIQVQTPSETFNGMKKFPILFLTLGSLDSWGRKKLEGIIIEIKILIRKTSSFDCS